MERLRGWVTEGVEIRRSRENAAGIVHWIVEEVEQWERIKGKEGRKEWR